MKMQKHTIGREILEITVSDRSTGMSIQNKLSAIAHQKLNPALNKAFSKLSAAEQTVKIDKLTIDLGSISLDDLDDGFVRKAIQQTEHQIKELLLAGKGQSDFAVQKTKAVNKTGEIEIEPETFGALNQFVFFLQKGYFSWQYSESSKNALNKLFDQVLAYKKEELKHHLQPVIAENAVKKRLTYQFSQVQLERLFIKLDESTFFKVHELFKIFLSLKGALRHKQQLISSFYRTYLDFKSRKPDFSKKDQAIQFFKEVIIKSFGDQKQEKREKWIVAIADEIAAKKPALNVSENVVFNAAIIEAAIAFPKPGKLLFETIVSLSVNDDPVISELITAFTKKHKPSSKIKESPEKPADFIDRVKKLTDQETLINKDDEEDKIKESESEKTYPADDAEQVFVSNAGLVLLHPFLRYFFEGINLLDKNLRFKNLDSQFKAIHLLQYIATGQQSMPENELTLNKILCGTDLFEPIPKNLVLDKEEKAECNHLIQTVLERWDALKTKKPGALRNTYIQRKGVLKRIGQGWNLHIERNTFDVMLEKLPWSISIIKFPWSDQMLNVEW